MLVGFGGAVAWACPVVMLSSRAQNPCLERLPPGYKAIAASLRGRGPAPAVPTLFRFLLVVSAIAALVLGGMLALVTFVKPEPREITEIVPPARLQPK